MPSEPPKFDPAEYQRPFWEPIGKFVFAFGYLEKDIEWCISALLNAEIHRQGPSVASQIRSLVSRISLVEALFRQLTADPKLRADMTEVRERIRALNTYRNGLLHGPWNSYHVEKQKWHKLRLNPQNFKLQAFDVQVSEIKERAKETLRVGVDLSNLVQGVAAGFYSAKKADPHA